MALKRLVIDGFGQIEPRNVTFTRDGRIEAQMPLAKGVTAENGMLLAVDVAKKEVKLPGESEKLPIAIHYSTEKIYNQFTPGLKNFKLTDKDGQYPRLGYLTAGDVFATNCISYDTDEFSAENTLTNAIKQVGTTPLYGGISTNGGIKITKTEPTAGPILVVAGATTMPDGQYAVEFLVK